MVAITDINRTNAVKRADEFHIPNVEIGAAELISRKDLDAIDIVVPNMFHRDLTIAALESGKHVLCEKPLALSVKEVDEMIAASEKSGKKLMCAQHMRFQNDSRALKEYTAKRPLGEVYYGRAWYNRRRQLPCTPGFMYKKNAGGGCCIDVGVHVLDLALHLMENFSPVSVSGVAGTKLACRKDAWSEWGKIDTENIDVEDFAAGLIRFANGAALSLECSFMLNQKAKHEGRINLFGTEAGLSWPECEVHDHTARDFMDIKLDVRPSSVAPHCVEIAEFAQAVLGNKPVPVPPQQSRAVIAILEGLYQSQATGSEVRIGG